MQIKAIKKARWHRFNYDNHALLQLFTRRVKSVLFDGGDEEVRTLDLTDANRTLSQLSYIPT